MENPIEDSFIRQLKIISIIDSRLKRGKIECLIRYWKAKLKTHNSFVCLLFFSVFFCSVYPAIDILCKHERTNYGQKLHSIGNVARSHGTYPPECKQMRSNVSILPENRWKDGRFRWILWLNMSYRNRIDISCFVKCTIELLNCMTFFIRHWMHDGIEIIS